MGLAKMRVFTTLMIIVLSLCGLTNATVHTVGDSAGWTIGGNDYQGWAATHTFAVGDILDFKYNKQSHNVKQVNVQDYNSCNSGSAIATFSSGSDSINLGTPGDYYFMCGFPGHCQAGMKFHISVSPSSSSPVPVPPSSSSCQPPPVGATFPWLPPADANFPTMTYTSAAPSCHFNFNLVSCLVMAVAFRLFFYLY